MTEWVETLVNVDLNGADFIFLIINESGYRTATQKAIGEALKTFSKDVGRLGRVVRADEGKSTMVFADALSKEWATEAKQVLQNKESPILIALKKKFKDFDPGKDEWAIVLLGRQANPSNAIAKLFENLATWTKEKRNILDALSNMTGTGPYGHILAWKSKGPSVKESLKKVKIGRPGPLDHWDLIAPVIERIKKENHWREKIPRGGKETIACEIEKELRKRKIMYSVKTIKDAITREGKW